MSEKISTLGEAISLIRSLTHENATLRQRLDAATAEADARVQAAVEAERERCKEAVGKVNAFTTARQAIDSLPATNALDIVKAEARLAGIERGLEVAIGLPQPSHHIWKEIAELRAELARAREGKK